MRPRPSTPVVLATAALAFAGPAHAEPPRVAVSASTVRGAAPLAVTLVASGDAAAYRWDLGDGAAADGASVVHAYLQPGVYRAVVTAVGPTGETAQATVTVTAVRVTLRAPPIVRWGSRATLRGTVEPAEAGAALELRAGETVAARTRVRADGSFAVTLRPRRPAAYVASVGGVASAPADVRVRPRLHVRLLRPRLAGGPLRAAATVRPADSGRLLLRVVRGGRPVRHAELQPGRPARVASAPGRYRVEVRLAPGPGFAAAAAVRTARLSRPPLAMGSRGPAVRALERRLAELRYVLPRVDGLFALDTWQAVLAFQKLNGLPWTGRVDARTGRALDRASAPRPRYRGGDHIEVSKGRQYLLLVRGGRVDAVVHVSTGLTGNTPLGRWRVYRKVVGWDWVLWYPLYFLRGFAVHGYPSVPAYPASHGCVRVPMWVATRIFRSIGYGSLVYVYP